MATIECERLERASVSTGDGPQRRLLELSCGPDHVTVLASDDELEELAITLGYFAVIHNRAPVAPVVEEAACTP